VLSVGDDVVDLGDPQIAEHHLRARFVERVCSREEASRARGDKRALWSLFAAKEAAYKVLVKLGHHVGFAHRDLVVAEGWRSVAFRDVRLDLRVEGDDEHVHAVAWIDAAPVTAVRRAQGDHSRAARALAAEVLARAGFCGDLEIVRDPVVGAWDGYGPPRVVSRAGAPIDADVSLSHDGRFVACAVSGSPRRALRAHESSRGPFG
jgi:4'-phosphopantetheinyl transferase EntD